MNFIPKGGSADYVNTGTWSQKALKEANIVATGRIAGSSEAEGFSKIPKQAELDLDPNAAYVHLTSNNTIKGTQYHAFPETGSVPLVADMSSDILWRPVRRQPVSPDLRRSAEKHRPVRRDHRHHQEIVARAGQPGPADHALLRHLFIKGLAVQHTADLCHLHGAERPGMVEGTTVVWRRWRRPTAPRATCLYSVFEESGGFYKSPVAEDSRSYMNVVFRLPSEELEAKFVAEAQGRRDGRSQGPPFGRRVPRIDLQRHAARGRPGPRRLHEGVRPHQRLITHRHQTSSDGLRPVRFFCATIQP